MIAVESFFDVSMKILSFVFSKLFSFSESTVISYYSNKIPSICYLYFKLLEPLRTSYCDIYYSYYSYFIVFVCSYTELYHSCNYL